VKSLSKILLALYLLILLWLVLFKLSLDVPSVLNYQMRSLNLIPFAGFSRGNSREMIDNFVVFIPLGLLLSINLKQVNFWRKFTFVFLLSVMVEVTQFVLAIGTTDITDVITNTLGGFFGLLLYGLGSKYVDNKKLDRCIVVVGAVLLVLLILLRFLVLKVRYHLAH
jgi:glycopeptide antibiotics resistance protein